MRLLPEEKSLLTTPRWFPIPKIAQEHPEQIRFKQSLKEFEGKYHIHVCAAGRRSYKTERFIKRHYAHIGCTQTGEMMMIGAPTHGQAKLIFWDDLKELIPKWCLADLSETELFLRFRSGSKLKVVGLESYERVEGTRWTRAAITEVQKIDPQFFPNTLQPILNDTRGEGILEGRPLGKNHLFDYFEMSKLDPEHWSSYHWKSSDILSKQQITAAQTDLALEDYQREYDASFEANSQQVYYAYTSANNREFELDLRQPLIIACDFNAMEKPMSWIIGQEDEVQETTYWKKALSVSFTNTETMCKLTEEWIRKYFQGSFPSHIIFYGDYNGTKHTSNSSRSDWEIITEHFRNLCQKLEKKIKPCEDIRDRNASTNGRLCNARGQRRMFVDKQGCRPLIKDWEHVQRMPNGINIDGSDSKRTHCSDAVDYYSQVEFPIHKTGLRVLSKD